MRVLYCNNAYKLFMTYLKRKVSTSDCISIAAGLIQNTNVSKRVKYKNAYIIQLIMLLNSL